MIVACPNCSTKYKLPDDQMRLGAKARCSICSEVFPLIPEQPANTAPTINERPQQKDITDAPKQSNPTDDLEDLLFGGANPEQMAPPTPKAAEPKRETAKPENKIDELDNESDNLFDETANTFGEPTTPEKPVTKPLASSVQPPTNNNLDELFSETNIDKSPSQAKQPDPSDDLFSHLTSDDNGSDFGDLFEDLESKTAQEAPSLAPSQSQQDELLEKQKADKLASELFAKHAFKVSSQSLEAESNKAFNKVDTNDLDFDNDEEPAAIVYGEPAASSKGNKKLSTKEDYKHNGANTIPPLAKKKEIAWGKIGLVLALILVILGAAGGFFWYKQQKMAAYEALLAEQRERLKLFTVVIENQFLLPNEKNVPPQTKIGTSGAASSTVTGKIFVITGFVKNNFPIAKRDIRLAASLLDSEGRLLAKKEQYAGTTATLFQLSVMDEKDLEGYLNSGTTILEKNSAVLPDTSIPFTFVFYRVFDKAAKVQINVISANDAESNIKTQNNTSTQSLPK